MANLLGQNIGTNYKGILNLDSTINTPLDATLRAVTDGEGNASPLQLSTDAVSLGGATGLNWDNTNKRLGIVTNAPAYTLDITGTIRFQGGSGTYAVDILPASGVRIQASSGSIRLINTFTKISGSAGVQLISNTFVGGEETPSARLHVKGSSTTSGTTSLLVQNSAGTNIFRITDDGAGYFGNLNQGLSGNNITLTQYFISAGSSGNCFGAFSGFAASAIVQCESTTRGFLPPRMTTTQKNAISSPVAGLVVYDTTTNKLACYNGTTWNDLF